MVARPGYARAMRRLASAPNLALATLWADALGSAGLDVRVFSRYLSGIAGGIPPQEAEPTLWVMDEGDFERATQLLRELRSPPRGPGWACAGCGERHGPQFGACWNCGALRG